MEKNIPKYDFNSPQKIDFEITTILNKHVSFYDLFRIEEGKIVEHWDIIEEIPEKSKWQNSNVKF